MKEERMRNSNQNKKLPEGQNCKLQTKANLITAKKLVDSKLKSEIN